MICILVSLAWPWAIPRGSSWGSVHQLQKMVSLKIWLSGSLCPQKAGLQVPWTFWLTFKHLTHKGLNTTIRLNTIQYFLMIRLLLQFHRRYNSKLMFRPHHINSSKSFNKFHRSSVYQEHHRIKLTSSYWANIPFWRCTLHHHANKD